MREPQKVKRFTLATTLPFSLGRAAATELDQASLLGMKIQAERTCLPGQELLLVNSG